MKTPIVYGVPALSQYRPQGSEKFARSLANQICGEYGRLEHRQFSDGEQEIQLTDLPRNRPAVIVGSTHAPAENFELFSTLIDTAWRYGAEPIIGVIPYFGYCRQDRAKYSGQSVGMAVRVKMLSGFPIDWLLTIDLHNEASTSVAEKMRFEMLSASKLFLSAMRLLSPEDMKDVVVASADVGRLNLVRDIYARELRVPAVSGDKHRIQEGVEHFGIIGDKDGVSGKTVYLIDDIVDTGTTLLRTIWALQAAGAKEVIGFATHAVLSGEMTKANLTRSGLERLYVTDTIFHSDIPDHVASGVQPFFNVISVVPLFAARIREILDFRDPVNQKTGEL